VQRAHTHTHTLSLSLSLSVSLADAESLATLEPFKRLTHIHEHTGSGTRIKQLPCSRLRSGGVVHHSCIRISQGASISTAKLARRGLATGFVRTPSLPGAPRVSCAGGYSCCPVCAAARTMDYSRTWCTSLWYQSWLWIQGCSQLGTCRHSAMDQDCEDSH